MRAHGGLGGTPWLISFFGPASSHWAWAGLTRPTLLLRSDGKAIAEDWSRLLAKMGVPCTLFDRGYLCLLTHGMARPRRSVSPCTLHSCNELVNCVREWDALWLCRFSRAQKVLSHNNLSALLCTPRDGGSWGPWHDHE